MSRILIVEDDLKLARLIAQFLTQHGFAVTQTHHGDDALPALHAHAPQLVVLDLMLPGRDGLQVCRDVRAVSPVPVLMLTAREDDVDVILGLEAGADEYVVKPVEPRVLLARIRALLRRPALCLSDAARLVFGELAIDRHTRTVALDGRPVEVTTMEFEMLWALASQAGTVLSRDDLLNTVRGIDFNGLDRSVDVCIGKLRRKLNDDARGPSRIKTVWGRGYLFARDPAHAAALAC